MVSLPAEAQIDADALNAAAATIRGLFADALRGAMTDVILGPGYGDEPQPDPELPELTSGEASLLDQYRRSSEAHRAAAHRTLDLGIPKEDR